MSKGPVNPNFFRHQQQSDTVVLPVGPPPVYWAEEDNTLLLPNNISEGPETDSSRVHYSRKLKEIVDRVNLVERENSDLRNEIVNREVNHEEEVISMNAKITALEELISSMNFQVKNKLDKIEHHLDTSK